MSIILCIPKLGCSSNAGTEVDAEAPSINESEFYHSKIDSMPERRETISQIDICHLFLASVWSIIHPIRRRDTPTK